MRELAGGIEPPFGYAECERQDRWLHLPDDLLHADVIDPETGESFEPGQRGELVISSLSYDAMPFVRFGYEDIVEFERGECPGCGRCGTRVRILGRVGDMLTIDGTEILPYDVSKVVQSVEEMPADLFQFYADSDEELRLKLGYDPELTDDVGPLEDTVAGRVENYTGVSVIVVDSVTEDELRDQGPTHKIPRIIEA
jgi:phenylacetate-CoA ligase